MRNRFIRIAAVTAGVALTGTATAMAGPGPIHRPPLSAPAKTAPVAIKVTVPTVRTLPSGRYAWAQPTFVRTASGLFLVIRTTGA